jgi:hypothetical protein
VLSNLTAFDPQRRCELLWLVLPHAVHVGRTFEGAGIMEPHFTNGEDAASGLTSMRTTRTVCRSASP